MRQWKLTSFALAGTVAVAGCSDALPTDPGPAASQAPPNALRGLNAEFTRLASEIPGFGGMYYDRDGNLNVYVAGNRTNRAALRSALASRVRGELSISAHMSSASNEMIVREADYDFDQLGRWYEQMRPVLGHEGVVFTDIDESQNRLKIGVEAGAPVDQIQTALAQFSVPAEAVTFEVTEPIVPLKGTNLQERVQPFAGGIQLVFPNPMPGFVSLCTLGFNILLNEPGRSQPYFVTNSHCTLDRGVVDNTPYYQQPVAFLDPQQLIGFEVVDPPFFTDPLLCPYAVSGYVCRISDAAIARYETSATPVRFGTIYRTSYFGTGTDAGSVDITTSGPKFFGIVDEIPFPLGGEMLDKVGRTTGWTRGPVIATCVDTGVSGTNIAMICQDFVGAAVGGGDSGSPVFQQIGDSKYANLYGILWGGGGDLYVFSAMENIHIELGAFQTH